MCVYVYNKQKVSHFSIKRLYKFYPVNVYTDMLRTHDTGSGHSLYLYDMAMPLYVCSDKTKELPIN